MKTSSGEGWERIRDPGKVSDLNPTGQEVADGWQGYAIPPLIIQQSRKLRTPGRFSECPKSDLSGSLTGKCPVLLFTPWM